MKVENEAYVIFYNIPHEEREGSIMLITGDPEIDLQAARKICSFESFNAYAPDGSWITSTEL